MQLAACTCALTQVILCLCFGGSYGRAQVSAVTTWRYDNTHSAANTRENILTPSNVNANTFGKLFSHPVDGYTYAQPLYVSNLRMPDGNIHNVMFVATEKDTVYAFDADNDLGNNAFPLWQVTMLDAAHGAGTGATPVPSVDTQSVDIKPVVGITATPVIDTSTQTMYLLAKTKEGGSYFIRLHALSLFDGSERSGSPKEIQASVPGLGRGSVGGVVSFIPLIEHSRPALDLYQGHLFFAFASHGDQFPFHGWIMEYDASTLQQISVSCTSCSAAAAKESGIWMSGAGMPIDSQGRLFAATGNGAMSPYPPFSNSGDLGDSIIRYDISNGLTPVDAFTPYNQAELSANDLDQGSGGILILPDQPGAHPHEIVQMGKSGDILLLDRDNLGGYKPDAGSNNYVVQSIPNPASYTISGGAWNTPAYWNGNVYVWGRNTVLQSRQLNSSGTLNPTPTSQGTLKSTGRPPTPVISSNGSQNGILWAIYTDPATEVLYAFNASNVSTQLYSSATNPTRDSAGGHNNFVLPVIANGKVMVGSNNQISVYGLLTAPRASAPTFSLAAGSYSGSQPLVLHTSTPGATIHYTTDGSNPTHSSAIYTAALSIKSSETIKAIATELGYIDSSISSATYTINSLAATPTFSPSAGSFSAEQRVSIVDSTPNATIYYTTNGSTPTHSSAVYSGPITVSSSETIKAIAGAAGFSDSAVGPAAYVITGPKLIINYGSGFASGNLHLNDRAALSGSRMRLVAGTTSSKGSGYYTTPVNIQSFTNDFTFQFNDPRADGMTFVIQNQGLNALGSDGGSLGYGGKTKITSSVAVKLDFNNNDGEGNDSTGIYTNGARPSVPAIDLSNTGVNLRGTDLMHVHMTYDGTTLNVTITDTNTSASATQKYTVNIPAIVGANTAYVGFTGSTGSRPSTQDIVTWTYRH